MASQNKINVSLTSKETPIVSLTISDDSGAIVASATDITPVIKFVTTGPAGPQGLNAVVNDGSITSAKIATNAVTTSKINSGAVTTAKLKVNSVTSGKIVTGAVTADKIAADAVDGSKIADNSIGAEHIIDGTVTAELLTDGLITANKYGDLSIATAKLQDLAVTSAKLSPNLSLDGVTTLKKIIGLGQSPFVIVGPDHDNFELVSNHDLIFQVDANQSTSDGAHSFIWKNGSGTQIAALDESGNLTISGTVDGLDISSLQNLYPTADATKVGFLTVTQAVNLDTIESNVATNNAKNTYPTADATKVGYLQITQSVDLDLIETNLAGVIDKTQHISVSQSVDLDAMETKLAGIATGAQVNHTRIDSDTMSGALSTNVASAESIKAYVDAEVAGIVDSAPGTLNTLNELAQALNDDAAFSTTVTDSIALKAPIASPTFTGTVAIPNIANLEQAVTANTGKPDLTIDGAGTVHANNYTNTEYSVMSSANSYAAGLVPAGSSLHQNKFLRKDGTFVSPLIYFGGDGIEFASTQISVDLKANGGLVIESGEIALDLGASSITNNITIPADLTSDGAGTIHVNNVPTLNQSTTGNAATATALTSGNKIIQGDLELQGNLLFSQTDGGPQSIHDAQDTAVITITDGGLTALLAADNLDIGAFDFRAESFTSDAATGQAPFTVSSTTEVANLRAATASALASGNQTINGDLTVTSGTSGDATLIISADTDNNDENDNPRLWFKADGDIIEGAIQHNNNTFDIISNISTSGGIRFLTGTTNNTGTTDPVTGATERMIIASGGEVTINNTLNVDGSYIYLYDQSGSGAKSRLSTATLTGNRTLELPDAGGTLALTNSLIDTKTAAYWSSSTSGFYITLSGSSTSENSSLSTASYTLMYVVPFDGKIKRISSFHQNAASGTSTFKLYIDGDDSPLTDNRGSDMTTSSFTRKFTEDCPADWTFSKGEALAIRRTDSVARYGVTMTIVFEYDTTT